MNYSYKANVKSTKSLLRILVILAIALSLVSNLVLLSKNVLADTTSGTLTFQGTYHQDDARAMLTQVNAFRTASGGQKCWNSTNTAEDIYGPVGALTYDYNLEQIAMQRAAEIAVLFEHKRPDGSDIRTIVVNGVATSGENLAYGSNTTQACFDQWAEADKKYSGQGHRRNMLGSSFTRIGIACFEYNGRKYWVQEFGGGANTSTQVPANNDLTNVEVPYSDTVDKVKLRLGMPTPYYSTGAYGSYGQTSTLLSSLGNLKEFKICLMRGDVVVEDVTDKATVVWHIKDSSGKSYDDYITYDKNKVTFFMDLKSSSDTYILSSSVSYGSYTGTLNNGHDINLTYSPTYLSSSQIEYSYQEVFEYNGSPVHPTVTASINGKKLVEGRDYTIVRYGNDNMITPSGYTAFIEIGPGTGSNFKGSNYLDYLIVGKDISKATVTGINSSYTYSGSAFKPVPVVTLDGKVLTSGTDYTVTYGTNTSVGTGTGKVTITGNGIYGGSVSKTFNITAIDISGATVSGVNTSYTYTGSALKPVPVVTLNSKTLVAGTDYTVTYDTNTSVGTGNGKVTITGKGNYRGTVSKSFDITAINLSSATVSGVSTSYAYTGSAYKPAPVVTLDGKTLVAGTDYTVSYTNNTNAGTATVVITGKGTYGGTINKSFTITAKSLSGATVSGVGTSYTYSGSAYKPAVTSVVLGGKTLVSGTDYTVTYGTNTNAGTGTVTVTGKGNYSGTVKKSFTITAKSLSGATVNGVGSSYTYTGSAIKPSVSSVVLGGKTLVNGTDYTISYGVNTSIGTSGTITITGKGNYTGTASKTFSITAQSISGATINGIGASYTYTGSAITPSVSSVVLGGKTLVNGTDYTVSYKNNTGVGTATVTITGKGIYSGTASKTFSITAKSLSGATINGIVASYTYTGSAINPSVSSVVLGGKTLVNGTDYTVSYGANTNVGTGTVIITGKGNYTGTVSKSFNIVKPAATTTSISGATIGNLNASYTYTGSAIAPTVTVTLNGKTLAMGTDYFVTYSGNTNVSSNGAKVTITGNGNYSGTISKTFSITAKSISGATVSGVNSSYVYTGSAFKPSVTVVLSGKTLTSGTDYTVTYSTNTAIGSTGTVTITGKGNYSGTIKKSFTITAKSLDGSTVSGISSSYTYTGSAIKPSVSVAIGGKTLVNGTDYTVTYGSNTNVGTGVGKVTITGKGTYGGTINKTFTITAKSISGATVNGVNASYTYTGSAIKPTVSSVVLSGKTLVNGTDYTVSYGANTSAGTGTVTITGKGNYSGTVTKSFTITKPTAKETGVEGFCERLYTCALNRASDKNGKANWVQQINYGMSGGDVAKQFFLSKELKNSGISNEEYVRRLYLTFFDREPDAAGKANWLNALNSKTLTREQVLQQFIDSTEWANLCLTFGIESGGKGVPTITVAPSDRVIAFATRLYTTCLGRQPDKTGLNTWSNNLANRKVTGQQAAITFFSSAEFKNHNYPNDEFIKRCYRTFLNREPDTTGYNAYLAALNNKSLTRDQMVKDFSTSTEFKRLCSSSGIKPY